MVRQIVASEVRAIAWMKRQDSNLLAACRWILLTERAFTGQEPVLSVGQYAMLLKNDILGISQITAFPARSLIPGGRLYQEFKFLIENHLLKNSTFVIYIVHFHLYG